MRKNDGEPQDIDGADITTLLRASGQGDANATDQLFQLIYAELRTLAKANRRRWVGQDTLNTTSLINEAFIKLRGRDDWSSRTHFYATAAKAMRHVLVNYAEQKKAAKRGGDVPDLRLDQVLLTSDDAIEEALNLDQTLSRLDQDKPRWARIVECRVFAGMTLDETAAALNISGATVGREWRLASAWLRRELGETAQTIDDGR